ncbi:MAG: hypothetical protein JWO59_1740 [Chloroflexi bacterium]|nr:hypothetical protein [Chloroflexota bacterium]
MVYNAVALPDWVRRRLGELLDNSLTPLCTPTGTRHEPVKIARGQCLLS